MRIRDYFSDTPANLNKYKINKIIVSSSDEVGEGEHKIFEYIRLSPELGGNKTSVIYGLDADLIMLSINHLPVNKNIFLFRETPEFIKSIDNSLEPNETYLMDIPLLAEIITLNMNNGVELTTVQQKNRIYDYIFLCFFLGNDFMPHFPALNIRTGGVDKMLGAYKATIGLNAHENLTDGKQIFWKNVRKLVAFLANIEEEYFKNETRLRDKREKYLLPEETAEQKYMKFDAIPTYERETEKYINPYKVGWQSRYYKSLLNVDRDEIRCKQISINYLQGLEWTMKYYTSGCPDWRWKYNYNYPPLLQDLLTFIPCFDTTYIKDSCAVAVSPYTQLSYVMPRQSLHFLPEKIYRRLNDEYLHWYPMDCEFTWAYSRYFWESHVNLPELDIDEIEKVIMNV
jgi:5'-3' exonuclease